MNEIVNKAIAFIITLVIGLSIAEPIPATITDLDYIMGPLDIIDGTEEEEETPQPYVYIEIVDPVRAIRIGDTVTLRCVVVGLDDVEYVIQWQYSKESDIGEFIDIECNEPEYVFLATNKNVGYYYRVVIYMK